MKKKFENVYQFKITLKGIKPPIWRRIQVPETYTFWDLHVAIQSSMGWTDTHLHHFEITKPSSGIREEIGIPDEDFIDESIIAGWKRKIADYFTNDNNKATYIYDYGDYWEHRIQLEKIVPRQRDITYPICLDGARACPPEDCGGTGGYEEFLEAIMDPLHEQHEEMLEWVGGDFDPEEFNKEDIVFADPKVALKYLLT